MLLSSDIIAIYIKNIIHAFLKYANREVIVTLGASVMDVQSLFSGPFHS